MIVTPHLAMFLLALARRVGKRQRLHAGALLLALQRAFVFLRFAFAFMQAREFGALARFILDRQRLRDFVLDLLLQQLVRKALARQHLLDALRSSKASNPLVLSGDVHTFYATELSRNATRPTGKDNPVLATEFCGTSITSSSRPQARTEQYVAMNPHIRYGRSDKRGYMVMEITPEKTPTLFQGRGNARDSASGIATLARFTVQDGKAGVQRI